MVLNSSSFCMLNLYDYYIRLIYTFYTIFLEFNNDCLLNYNIVSKSHNIEILVKDTHGFKFRFEDKKISSMHMLIKFDLLKAFALCIHHLIPVYLVYGTFEFQ